VRLLRTSIESQILTGAALRSSPRAQVRSESILLHGDGLNGEDVLPGFACPFAEIF